MFELVSLLGLPVSFSLDSRTSTSTTRAEDLRGPGRWTAPLAETRGDMVRLTAAVGQLRDRGVMTLLNSLSSPMLDARSVLEDPPFLFVAAIPFPTGLSFRNPEDDEDED